MMKSVWGVTWTKLIVSRCMSDFTYRSAHGSWSMYSLSCCSVLRRLMCSASDSPSAAGPGIGPTSSSDDTSASSGAKRLRSSFDMTMYLYVYVCSLCETTNDADARTTEVDLSSRPICILNRTTRKPGAAYHWETHTRTLPPAILLATPDPVLHWEPTPRRRGWCILT